VKIVADLMESEDPKKLLRALKKLFPDANFTVGPSFIEGESDLEEFWTLVDKAKIGPTIEELIDANGFVDLNKIAALAGKVAIDQGSPIGKIRVFFSK